MQAGSLPLMFSSSALLFAEHNPSATEDQPMAEAPASTDQGHPDPSGVSAAAEQQPDPEQSVQEPAEHQPLQTELPAEYASSFAQVLAALTGSRVSTGSRLQGPLADLALCHFEAWSCATSSAATWHIMQESLDQVCV